MRTALVALPFAAALFSSPTQAAEPFALYDVTLGSGFNEAAAHLQNLCPRGCPAYTSQNATGIAELQVFIKFATVYFSNTRRTEVDRAKPYEAVIITTGPGKKVISITGEVYSDPLTARTYADKMAARAPMPLQAFSEMNKDTRIDLRADASTDHALNLYAPYLRGQRMQISHWQTRPGTAIARVMLMDFDAMRQLEASNPQAFAQLRKAHHLPMRRHGTEGLAPRVGSSLELSRAPGYPSAAGAPVTKLVDGRDSLKVVAEQTEGPNKAPSQLMVNGVVVAKAALFDDGMTFEGVQKLDQAPGLYRVHASWFGNGCSAQQELLLNVTDGKGYLSEPFGRCNTLLTVNNGAYYFSYEADEYESATTLVVQ